MIQAIAITIWGWLEHMGGIGLILLGFVDNSPLPLPGGMDALTVILAANQKHWWWYYAIMATIGGVLGGYMTFSVARKGGKEGLKKKLTRKKAAWARKTFEKYGFWSVFVPALLPPPVPYSPFLIVAGGLDYSRRKFLLAVGTARTIRYFALAYLGSSYSRQIFGFFHQYYKPMLWTLSALAVAGGVAAGLYAWKRRREGKPILPDAGEQRVKAA
ncbi:MAG TPA: VTT domain-containing protein [Candidatus Angelobacter sp.]